MTRNQSPSPIKGYEATYYPKKGKVCITCTAVQPTQINWYTKEEIQTLQANGDYFSLLYSYALQKFPDEDVKRNSSH